MSIVDIQILSEGQKIDPAVVVTQVDIIHEVNRIPWAQIMFTDGDAAIQEFQISNAELFIPGKKVEINLGRDEEMTTVFKGLVVKHRLEADGKGSFLSIELKDPAIKLTSTTKDAVFREITDDQIIKQIAEDGGLEPGEFAEAKATHEELVQHRCTDWDFILNRADVNGLWVNITQGAISLTDPTAIDTGSPQHSIGYGMDEIYSMQLEADGEEQYETIESIGWDIQNQTGTDPLVATAFSTGLGNLDPVSIAGATGTGSFVLKSGISLLPEELQAWADAKMRKTRLSLIRGRISFAGRTDIWPLEVIEISGMGDRFNGNAIITGVRHRITTGGWRTDLQIGIDQNWFSKRHSITDQPAGGLAPGIHNLQIGIVDIFEDDPKKNFRVKVQIPAWGEEAGPVWARLAHPDAGNGRGFFFHPEPGDEVIVGFFNSDPRQPVILGGMYSENQAPPVEAGKINEENFIKGLYSREGLQMWFDDENKALHLLTSDDQTISLNEKDKAIEIKDVNGNIISMNDKGITIKSAKNISLEAAENVEIKGKKVDVK